MWSGRVALLGARVPLGLYILVSSIDSVQQLAAKPPAVQGSGLAGAKFELQSQTARPQASFFVDWSRVQLDLERP